LCRALAQGALVLTVNKRLARALRSRFDAWMSAAGCEVWGTPRIQGLDTWLLRCAGELDEDAGLLSESASLYLWERVIEAEVAGSELALLQVPASARRAQEAHRLLVEYGVDLSGYPLSDDHRAFLRWRAAYLDACRRGDWSDSVLLPERICAALADGRLTPPAQVFVAGFDDPPPHLTRLCAALEEAGCRVTEWSGLLPASGACLRTAALDAEDEVRMAARWVRRLLEEGAPRIGVVVADLQQRRRLVERVFREELAPDSLIDLEGTEERFNLSLGSPLAEEGLVTAALDLLGLSGRISLDRLSFLLRSPYLGGAPREGAARARCDRKLRAGRRESFSLTHPPAEIAASLPEFSAILAALAARGGNRRRPLGEWMAAFGELLAAVGWPGERPLGSLEFQALKVWKERLLPAVIELEPVSGPLEHDTALDLLRRLARETTFQPETPDGPVQVLGLLESAGLEFDHLWVMGLTDEIFPAPARPNPFLPVPLQVACAMPHAGAERELTFACALRDRLSASAPKVVFSHPLKEGDVELRPSSLILDFAAGLPLLAGSAAPLAVTEGLSPPLETLCDETGPPLAAARAVGGTAILKDQALCPFRAFARHRLAARGLEHPEPGLDAATRGSLLHRVLENFWRETGDQAALIALSEEGLDERIAGTVARVLGERFGEEAQAPLCRIEGTRLWALAREWLEAEKGRTPFTVHGLEEQRAVVCGPLTVDTRIDRIDLLADGGRLIVDYKTGRVDLNDLLGERLLEPQLPVYAGEESAETLAGVAIAQVRRGDCLFKGVAAADDLLPKISAFAGSKAAEKAGLNDWPELLQRWRNQLTELGGEFARGWAAVAPVAPDKACKFCDLAPLCRIDETLVADEEAAS
jgi:probable DNA repair protein